MPAPIRDQWYTRPGWSEFKALRGGTPTHWGHDSYCKPLTSIYAIGDGEVVAVGHAAGGFGFYGDVWYPALEVRQREAHMNEAAYVTVGQKVTAATRLGRVGRTGNAAGIKWVREGIELWHVHSQTWRSRTTNGDLLVNPIDYWGLPATLRTGSLVTLEQALKISGWLGRRYDTYQYWHDLQTWAIRINAYPQAKHDGIPGPLSFKAELAVYDHYIKPAPLPPVDPPSEPSVPEPADETPPAPEPEIETPEHQEDTMPIINPDPSQENLDHAAEVITEQLSPLIPLTIRKRLYEGLVAAAAIALALAPIFGGEVGTWMLTGGTVVGVAAGTLARTNAWDPQ